MMGGLNMAWGDMDFIPKTSNNSEFVKKSLETTSLCDQITLRNSISLLSSTSSSLAQLFPGWTNMGSQKLIETTTRSSPICYSCHFKLCAMFRCSDRLRCLESLDFQRTHHANGNPLTLSMERDLPKSHPQWRKNGWNSWELSISKGLWQICLSILSEKIFAKPINRNKYSI